MPARASRRSICRCWRTEPRPKYSLEARERRRAARDRRTKARAKSTLWQATNPEARDFRVDTIGKAYTKTPLEPQSDGTYLAQVDKPAKGFTAFFVELVYPTGHEYPLKFTTRVYVVPDVLPFAGKMPSGTGK